VAEDFYSIDEVAERLGLHVRTVRNHVRDGKLKAVRIGKQYRIAREDLEALTGRAAVRRTRHSEVSSIVEIDALPREMADRVTTALMAAANSRDPTDAPLRIDTIYDEERARLKVIVTGGIATTASLLKFVEVLLQS
jgi:excisionase family DNA binding protein